jgi:sensor histidine kinase regulating citrate/malate metabolism
MAGLKKKMTGFGLAKKLAASITIFLLILSVTLTIINVKTQETAVRQRLHDTANGTVSLLKESATDPMILLQIHKLRVLLADVLKQEEAIYAYAFDNEGRILTDGTKENPFRDKILDNVISKRSEITETVSSQHKTDILDITRPIYFSGKMLGGIRVGFTLKKVREEIIDVRNRNIYLGAIFVLIGIGFTFILARVITKPIYNLQKGIELIG